MEGKNETDKERGKKMLKRKKLLYNKSSAYFISWESGEKVQRKREREVVCVCVRVLGGYGNRTTLNLHVKLQRERERVRKCVGRRERGMVERLGRN